MASVGSAGDEGGSYLPRALREFVLAEKMRNALAMMGEDWYIFCGVCCFVDSRRMG